MFESLRCSAGRPYTLSAFKLVRGRPSFEILGEVFYIAFPGFLLRHLTVMNRSNNNSRRIYVGNLPSNIDERDLEDIFYKYGDIADVDLKIPRYGTGGTPFAFVEFHDPRYVEMKFYTPVKLPC